MTHIDKVLDRLAKLKAAREGEAAIGNQEAADAFAAAVNRLLIQHELCEADIPKPGVQEEPIVELMADLAAHGIKFTATRIGWQEALARIVADAHLCKFLVTTGTNYITFVGTRQHVEVAAYAYGVLCSAADRMSMTAREDYWKRECGGRHLASGNFRAAWLHGFVSRIAERFAEARRAEVAASVLSSSTALMRLDKALVRAKDYVDERYKRKAPSPRMRTGSVAGYREGRAAADAMAIGRKGIGSGVKGYLKGGAQ